jgi:hypothetical protein
MLYLVMIMRNVAQRNVRIRTTYALLARAATSSQPQMPETAPSKGWNAFICLPAVAEATRLSMQLCEASNHGEGNQAE